jgi:hypothetical protein
MNTRFWELDRTSGAADSPLQSFPRISTVFDCDDNSPQRILHSSSIRNTLMRLLPAQCFLSDEVPSLLIEEYLRPLPIVKSVVWGEGHLQISIYLLCRHRANGVKFFYEMISRWLLPGKRLNIPSFFATDFMLSELSSELLSLCEVVISMDSQADLTRARYQLPIIENEIRMGLLSVYHANRILEIKGLSSDEKTSLIQERIASLLERRPKDFDHDLFVQMQHFLVMCSEEFKGVRDYACMSRIIYVFYLFRRALKGQVEKNRNQRFVYLKVSRTLLHFTFGVRKVLGVFIALNYLEEHELFEERQCSGVFKSLFPQLEIVEDSWFFRSFKEEGIQLLYLEVEKTDATDFTLLEIQQIKTQLPGEIKNGVEKLAHPLFMPRNEEEVMRNIITLSHQLKFSRDLPQVIINFDTQSGSELAYTVIWLRVLKEGDGALQEVFERDESYLKFVPDRIKQVGFLRKKHPKEATVFRVKFSTDRFLRADHSVDLFDARRAIAAELQRLFGEFRDYNGGMIAKQHEQLIHLKHLTAPLDRNGQLLLENFFHSISPIELCSLFNPMYLKNLFSLLLQATQKSKVVGPKVPLLQHIDESCCYFLIFFEDSSLKEKVMECMRAFQVPSSQFLTISVEQSGISYLGCVYLHRLLPKWALLSAVDGFCAHLKKIFESKVDS